MTQVPKASEHPVRKERAPVEVSDEIISDHIKDDYEDDFENIEESSRIKNSAKLARNATAGFGGGKVSGEPEESSGGFDEKYDEDFF